MSVFRGECNRLFSLLTGWYAVFLAEPQQQQHGGLYTHTHTLYAVTHQSNSPTWGKCFPCPSCANPDRHRGLFAVFTHRNVDQIQNSWRCYNNTDSTIAIVKQDNAWEKLLSTQTITNHSIYWFAINQHVSINSDRDQSLMYDMITKI